MKSKRLRAYQVMLRVARVKEIRASMALAQAVRDEDLQRTNLDSVVEARNTVTNAGHGRHSADGALDMARYGMLVELGDALDGSLIEARQMLAGAVEFAQELAGASLLAKRHRENIDGHAVDARQGLQQVRSANAREVAIEQWLKGKSR